MSTAPTLRQLLEQGLVLAPGIYNAMGARLVEQTGFAAVYVSGFGTAARYGYADVGLVTQTEMVDNLRYICRATTLPVIADENLAPPVPATFVFLKVEIDNALEDGQ